MRNLKIGLIDLKQDMFLRHCPVYQGIEENYLYLKMISVVEVKIAKKNLKAKTQRGKRGKGGINVQSCVQSVSLEGIN